MEWMLVLLVDSTRVDVNLLAAGAVKAEPLHNDVAKRSAKRTRQK